MCWTASIHQTYKPITRFHKTTFNYRVIFTLQIPTTKALGVLQCSPYTYCTLRGRIIGAASAISIIQDSLRGDARNKARHVIMVVVLAFLTQENKAGKMQKYN